MIWYKKSIVNYLKENWTSLLFVLIFPFILLLWNYLTGKNFVWHNISPLDTPDWQRYLYSALTFVSLGLLLYKIRFYQLLYFIFVTILGDFRSYKEIKGIIWVGLMLLMYFKIVPWFVSVLNVVISFFYNIFGFVLYSIPPLGITFFIVVPFVLFKKYAFNELSKK